MIELTEQQVQALEGVSVGPPEITNPRTRETYVLVPVDEYRRLKEELYDDSPWTTEELYLLAWESGKHAGWEDLDDYDDFHASAWDFSRLLPSVPEMTNDETQMTNQIRMTKHEER